MDLIVKKEVFLQTKFKADPISFIDQILYPDSAFLCQLVKNKIPDNLEEIFGQIDNPIYKKLESTGEELTEHKELAAQLSNLKKKEEAQNFREFLDNYQRYYGEDQIYQELKASSNFKKADEILSNNCKNTKHYLELGKFLHLFKENSNANFLDYLILTCRYREKTENMDYAWEFINKLIKIYDISFHSQQLLYYKCHCVQTGVIDKKCRADNKIPEESYPKWDTLEILINQKKFNTFSLKAYSLWIPLILKHNHLLEKLVNFSGSGFGFSYAIILNQTKTWPIFQRKNIIPSISGLILIVQKDLTDLKDWVDSRWKPDMTLQSLIYSNTDEKDLGWEPYNIDSFLAWLIPKVKPENIDITRLLDSQPGKISKKGIKILSSRKKEVIEYMDKKKDYYLTMVKYGAKIDSEMFIIWIMSQKDNDKKEKAIKKVIKFDALVRISGIEPLDLIFVGSVSLFNWFWQKRKITLSEKWIDLAKENGYSALAERITELLNN